MEVKFRKVISTKNAPSAIGPYSQGMAAKGTMVFTSGQIPLDPATGSIVGSDVEAQTRQALANVRAVLEAAGAALKDVVKTTVYLADMNDFSAMNSVYSQFFTENYPARSAVQVARLPKDVKVEVEAVAFI